MWGDGGKTWEAWFNDIVPEGYEGIGLSNIDEGTMNISGVFRSSDYATSFNIDISTEPFTLVREGNNFYFL